MMRAYPTTLVLLLSGLVLLPAIVGCDERADPCRPTVPAGRIQGHVLAGGLPVDAEIEATRVADSNAATKFVVETVPDANGFYNLDVPAGNYTILLRVEGYRARYDYARPVLGYGNIPPDTVRVDMSNSPVTIDFELSGLTFELELSGRLDGERGDLVLHRRDAEDVEFSPTYYDRADAKIENGRLSLQIAGVLAGEYQLEIVLEQGYGYEHFWMPGTRDRLASPWYEVVADSVVALTCTVATDPARIEGRIVGAWQDMGLVNPPELAIVDLDSVTTISRLLVNGDGSFAVDLHLPGSVKLLVTQNGVQQWIGGPSFDKATIYTLQLGQTISDIELVQSGLRFRVEGPGQATGSATFALYDPVDLALLVTIRRDLYGIRQIAMPNLWPGDFLIHVSPPAWEMGSASWRPQWFDRAASAAEARPIRISSAGEIVALDLTLELGGVISGRVEQGAGTPKSYDIIVTPASDEAYWAYDYAWYADPQFLFRGVPDGEFKVGASFTGLGWDHVGPPPEGTIWYPNTTDWNASKVIEIRDAGTVSDVVIEVP